jgi:hypothetical protein
MKPELGADGSDLSGFPEVGGPFVSGWPICSGRSQSGPRVAFLKPDSPVLLGI